MAILKVFSRPNIHGKYTWLDRCSCSIGTGVRHMFVCDTDCILFQLYSAKSQWGGFFSGRTRRRVWQTRLPPMRINKLRTSQLEWRRLIQWVFSTFESISLFNLNPTQLNEASNEDWQVPKKCFLLSLISVGGIIEPRQLYRCLWQWILQPFPQYPPS